MNPSVRMSVAAVWRGQTTDVVVVLGKLPQEGKANTADRAVTLLTDDNFGGAFVWRIRIVNFIPVNEQNNVSILLDSAGFTQVGHHWTFVRALFQRTVQLGQSDHRTIQLFGEALQASRNFGNFGGAVFTTVAAAVTGHQLQVVDDDKAELTALARQTTRACTQLNRAQCRGFIDVELRIVHLLNGVRQAWPVFINQTAGTQTMLVKTAYRAQHTHRELSAAHFHGEHSNRQPAVDGNVFTDVDGKRGFTHRRTTGDDDQVARLQAGGHLVKIDEAGRYTGDVAGAVAVVEFVDALDHLGQQRLDRQETLGAARTFFGNSENLGFSFVQHLLDVLALRVEGVAGNFVGNGNQLAQHAAVAHDFSVTADIGCGRRVLRQRIEIAQAAHFFSLAAGRHCLVDGDDVGRLAFVDQLDDVLENDAVIVTIKILGADEVSDTVPRSVIQQQTTQYGLFGFDRVRRDTQGFYLRIGRCAHGAHYTC